MDTSALVLGLRVLLSLACVLGLLWFLARRLSGPQGTRRRATPVAVLGRQSLGGKAGVVLVEVAGRQLLLGVAEHGVTLLTEVEAPADTTGSGGSDERTVLDPAAIERLVADVPADLSGLTELSGSAVTRAAAAAVTGAAVPHDRYPDQRPDQHPGLRADPSPSAPAARMPAVPTPRNPLEGSILDVTLWRRAVVAVQERTIRR